jgi:hypothetical protein
MGLQEIIAYTIVMAAFIYVAYYLAMIFINKPDKPTSCGNCSGACNPKT